MTDSLELAAALRARAIANARLGFRLRKVKADGMADLLVANTLLLDAASRVLSALPGEDESLRRQLLNAELASCTTLAAADGNWTLVARTNRESADLAVALVARAGLTRRADILASIVADPIETTGPVREVAAAARARALAEVRAALVALPAALGFTEEEYRRGFSAGRAAALEAVANVPAEPHRA